MNVSLKPLIGKLTESARRALEAAAGLCVSRTHYEVEPEHWIVKMLDAPDGDAARLCRVLGIDPAAAQRQLDRALTSFKTGNARNPQLSPDIESVIRDAWVYATIELGQLKVRSGVLLLAAVSAAALRRRLIESAPLLDQLKPAAVTATLATAVAGSAEDHEVVTLSGTERELQARAGTAPSNSPALDQYTVDLTALAAQGRVDPVLGRDGEIRQIIDILTRRRQNNPILTGEAGVGKTAVVEGFAARVAANDVPGPLCGIAVRSLDLGLLQAGAGVKGEFENRLKQVIEEVRASPRPIVLFIDEAHTMIGAGGQAGQNDAANLLKPALARGELRTIAATTWSEYKRYFEKDAALSRRFQVVKVDEPDEATAIRMMRGVCGKLATHHKVRILDSAVADSVRLSLRYLPARQLPDKSVSVLDTACARVAIGQNATPTALADLRQHIAALDTELELLRQEEALGANHRARVAELGKARAAHADDLTTLDGRWQQEKALLGRVLELRAEHAKAADSKEAQRLARDADAALVALRAVQGESPLLAVDVDSQTIAAVISAWTGVPVGRMVQDEIQAVLTLPSRLQQRVLGQEHALEAIAKRIRTARARLDNPARPIGVFLLVGPSGVGKTETALALADALYGGERNLITVNMSEYQEAHTVSKLKGSPPGYVGYGEGGVLTEAVRRRPYSVVLLDEVEKAHPDVLQLFFQVFDKGRLEDGEGREIDFKNTVILMTSNVAGDAIVKLSADPDTRPDPEPLTETIRPELLANFPAAWLGRLVVVPFYPIAPDVLRGIIQLQLRRIVERVRANHAIDLVLDDRLVAWIIDRCHEAESGARNVDRILTHSLLPSLSAELLSRMARQEVVQHVTVSIDGGTFRCETR